MDAHNDDVTGGRGERRRGWSPRWARIVAGIGVLLGLVPLGYGIGLLITAAIEKTGDTAESVGVALGQVFTLYGVLVVALLGWFLVRGGTVPFILGIGLGAIGLAYAATVF